MSGNLDALGDLLTAGLAARSLDSAGIDAAAVADAHHQCANCGAALDGAFCANCGQQAHVHRSLAHVGEEFLHGITHFDGKAWKTLPLLLFRPGRLTRDYIMGKRARYIAPVPLFLLVVFLMFLVFSFVHIDYNALNSNAIPVAEAKAALAESNHSLAVIDADIAKARAAGKTAELTSLTNARAGVAAINKRIAARARGEKVADLSVGDEIRAAMDSGKLQVELGNVTVNDKIRAALRNPELAFYKVQGKLYKFSFLLVPLSLPWLWLMFAFRRDVRMYDHAVFALYSISFMSLLFVVGCIALTLDVTNGLFWGLLVFVAPLAHMFAQLKGTYALGNIGAAWRTAGLALGSVISLSLYVALMVIVGLID